MKYQLFNLYFLEQEDEHVDWIRLFPEEETLMSGRGVYRDELLVLLYPDEVNRIVDLEGIRAQLKLEELPIWDKSRYLVHMGQEKDGYPIDNAVDLTTGESLSGEELAPVLELIERVFQ
jgi:hypothetical protein